MGRGRDDGDAREHAGQVPDPAWAGRRDVAERERAAVRGPAAAGGLRAAGQGLPDRI